MEDNSIFQIQFADKQEAPAVGRVRCLVDLGPIKIALKFFILDCNVPCVLHIPFLQTVNPTIDCVARSVEVCTAAGISFLEVVS